MKINIDQIVRDTQDKGGTSTSLFDGTSPTTGFMVSVGGGIPIAEGAFFFGFAGLMNLQEIAARNIGQPVYLGTWYDRPNREVWIDLSENIQDYERAMALAELRGEKAIYNVITGKDHVIRYE